MITIYSKAQVKQIDENTTKQQRISGWQLMERAAKKLTAAIIDKFPDPDTIFCVICGKGNNGGDGLAVARMLKNEFRTVEVVVLDSTSTTDEHRLNLQNVKHHSKIPTFSWADFDKNTTANVVIDAVLGFSCDRKPESLYKESIEWINNCVKNVVSIDIPSGMPCDFIPDWPCVQADFTLSIGFPKLTSLLPETSPNYGIIRHIDINHTPLDLKTENFVLDLKTIESIRKPRPQFGHKGTFGHAALMTGSNGMIGASVLSARACTRSGVGLVTVCAPSIGYNIIQSTVPEALFLTNGTDFLEENLTRLEQFDSIGIGCGIGTNAITKRWLKDLLNSYKGPCVLDADALNIIAEDQIAFPQNCIITPHPKEFDRLFGPSTNTLERIKKQKLLSIENEIVIVLKGHHTSISDHKGNVYFNSTGNNGMAKGGSGDVLTGLITGILAQGYSSLDAAILGVFQHGQAGDKAAKDIGLSSMIASDIIQRL